MAVVTGDIALVTVITAAALLAGASGQTNCVPAMASLAPCFGFLTGNSSSPPTQCCSQLTSLVQSQSRCLCTFLSGAAPMPFRMTMNQTQVLTLPVSCRVQTPPINQCNAAAGGTAISPVGPPTASPRASPSPSLAPPSETTGTPSPPSTPSVIPSGSSGSKTDGQSSGARTSARLALSGFFVVLVSSIASAFVNF